MNQISTKLNKLLEKNNLSVADISRATGIRGSTLYDIANGTAKSPRIDTIIKICDVLDISVDEFLKGEQGRLKSIEKRIDKLEYKKKLKALNMIEGITYAIEHE
ncbi:helix-turn-helix transcriptional regulator [Moraxella lincolnii]|uniref:helix-turn-helix domain-containing protein n=1 Tax=Lwoffella lincolnii TaxID=90241 RepID=UPI0030D61E0B